MQLIDISSNQQLIVQDLLIAVQSIFALIPGPLGIYAAHSAFSFTWQAAAQVISVRNFMSHISEAMLTLKS